MEPEPDEIRLGLQGRTRDTGALHSNWKFGSVLPSFLIVPTEFANLVGLCILVVNADAEDVLVLVANHSELGVMGGLKSSREFAVVPLSATIATLYNVKW